MEHNFVIKRLRIVQKNSTYLEKPASIKLKIVLISI